MPSALETLVKILKLEREQGYKNSAVIGGLAAFCDKWAGDAHAQARKPEHHLLVDELTVLLRQYDAIAGRDERHKTVNYMLDRITNRVPPPPEYQAPPQPEQATPPPGDATPEGEPPPAPPAPEQPAAQAQPQPRQPYQERRQEQRPEQRRDRPQRDQRRHEGKSPQGRPPAPQQRRGGEDDEGDEGMEFEGRSGLDDAMGGRTSAPVKLDLPPRPKLARPPRKPRQPIDPERAADVLRGLNAPVETVRGVGEHKAELLGKVGVETINDLLFYLPRRYDDYTQILPIKRLRPDMVATVIGTVRHTEVRIGRNNRRDFSLTLDDGSALMSVMFFGQFYLDRYIKPGQQIVLRGTTTLFGSRVQMTNPEWEQLDTENLSAASIVPVYPLTEGLTARGLRKLMKDTVEYWAERLPDYMPEGVLERADLADLGWTIKNLHFPESFDHLKHARRRYIFDQLLVLQLAILANRRLWQSVPAEPLYVNDDWLNWLTSAVFPYELTGAQRRVIADIRGDIARNVPMNRLLQGDVGSGKTAVALTAMMMAVVNGKQAALMAPTSILAEQHYRTISAALDTLPGDRRIVVGLLTSALTATEREAIYNGLRDGSIDIIIGTHAVIQEGVEFKDLALAIIDEQHRFGVEQRGALRGKGTNPHLLVMTATPIPRTLALTIYADLDLSVMDEMPPGRLPVQTRVLEPKQRERAYNFVQSQLDQGRQAFIVYPLVEASDRIEAESATEAYEKLQPVFRSNKIGLLHGRMSPREKDEVMRAFRDKQFDVLVTTSVAEVGVDIPNASVMMIEHANRFGLAQIHQFRGRVGRGGHASYCLLVSDTKVEEALERLHALEATNDGFKLAEIDWQIRGPGDLVGTRQSGQALLKLAEGITPELVELAQREAKTIVEDDPELTHEQHRLLAQRVGLLRDERSDVS